MLPAHTTTLPTLTSVAFRLSVYAVRVCIQTTFAVLTTSYSITRSVTAGDSVIFSVEFYKNVTYKIKLEECIIKVSHKWCLSVSFRLELA